MGYCFTEDFLLTNETGKRLYNSYAKDLPIIDYHCHLLPEEIYENKQFEDIGEMWLAHDHYKWRVMRAFGIDEKYITGDASYYEKYKAFAQILPSLIGNPIYIWCALELKRFFGIDEPIDDNNADKIYQLTKRIIRERDMTPRSCMELSGVVMACTTDDPIDSLEYHMKLKNDPNVKAKILSTFRPDKVLYCENPDFDEYIGRLSAASDIHIDSFNDVINALEIRMEFFASVGSIISDHGIEELYWQNYTSQEIEDIFSRARRGKQLSEKDIAKYRSAFLMAVGALYHKHDFVMQLHIGTYQGANKAGERCTGRSTGFDGTDDSTPVKSVGELLNRLSEAGRLPRTILYPLESSKVETWAILAGSFCGKGIKARVQLGAPWWFNDQSYGIDRQFEAVANLYPISLSIGMLTDSRSFLSYPRHELYRRCLCNYFGRLVERGEYFSNEAYLEEIIQNICYYNAEEYFRCDIK